MIDLFHQILGGAWFFGSCEECQQTKTFHTDRARDLWERNHAHQEDPA